MSREYVVFANVDGEMRVLRLLSNAPCDTIGKLCHEMAEKLFVERTVRTLWIGPWPTVAVENSSIERAVVNR